MKKVIVSVGLVVLGAAAWFLLVRSGGENEFAVPTPAGGLPDLARSEPPPPPGPIRDRAATPPEDLGEKSTAMLRKSDGDPKKDEKWGSDRWWVPIPPDKFVEVFQAKEASRGAFIEKFDSDGDGVLSDEERAAVFAKELELSEQEMLRYFDRDGDGVLSAIEREEGEAILAAKRSEAGRDVAAENRWQAQRLARFDADGDGVLNLDESYSAYLSDVQSKAAWRFRERYDADADGTIGPPDLEAFLLLYGENDGKADANDDGVINERDIEAFELMMSRQEPTGDTP